MEKIKTIEELTADKANPRKMTDKSASGLRASIAQFGDISGITFNTRTGELVTGHQRVSQLRKTYGENLPIRWLDEHNGVIETKSGDFAVRLVDWSAAKQRAANVAANSHKIQGEYDDTLSEYLLAFADDIAAEMPSLMDDVYLTDLITTTNDDSEDKVDETIPDFEKAKALCDKWGVEFGQVWQVEGESAHRVMCGDSTSADNVATLMDGDLCDLVMTSPPYAQQREYDKESKAELGDWYAMMCGVFSAMPAHDKTQLIVNLGLVYKTQWIEYWREWIEWMEKQQNWRRFGWYVWDQGGALPGLANGRLGRNFEFLFHFNKESVDPQKWVEKLPQSIKPFGKTVMKSTNDSAKYSKPESGLQTHKIPDALVRVTRTGVAGMLHPAYFPVGLPAYFIRSWPGIVYEPFLGSGTTVLAADRHLQNSYGMEISPRYLAVCLQRFSDCGLTCELVE